MLETLSFTPLWDKKKKGSDLQVTVFKTSGKTLQQQIHITLKDETSDQLQ